MQNDLEANKQNAIALYRTVYLGDSAVKTGHPHISLGEKTEFLITDH